jgi:hypothetical protein
MNQRIGHNDIIFDILSSICNILDMRTTLNIDDKLHAVVQSLARNNKSSLSKTVEVLLRRGLQAEAGVAHDKILDRDSDTGFPLLQSARPITSTDVRSLEDEQ